MLRRYFDIIATCILIPSVITLIVMWADVRDLKANKADKLEVERIVGEIKLNTQTSAMLARAVEELKEEIKLIRK